MCSARLPGLARSCEATYCQWALLGCPAKHTRTLAMRRGAYGQH